jgi:choline transport protein
MEIVVSAQGHENYTSSPDSEKNAPAPVDRDPSVSEINETGHKQELERNFSLLSICSVGIVTGNIWSALGGSIVVAL